MGSKLAKVTFWGVRGSVACSGLEYDVFGGATSCVSIESEKRSIILDAGTGIKDFGRVINQEKPCHLFFSHAHYDHYIGLPFFAPLWSPKFNLEIFSGPIENMVSTEQFIDSIFQSPQFPVTRSALLAKVKTYDLTVGDAFMLGDDFKINTISLNHPNGATGYRIDHNGKSICYITDHEHESNTPDPKLVQFVQGADIMIYDSTYTHSDYQSHKGWGHSTWNAGVELSNCAKVGQFIGFHHAHMYCDTQMLSIEDEMRKVSPNSMMARQGMTIEI